MRSVFITGQTRQDVLQWAAFSPEKVGQRDDSFPRLKEIGAGASVAIPTVNIHSLHSVTNEAERRFRFYVAVLQQTGDHRLGKAFITELIQLVPSSAVLPLFLVALGGRFGYLIVRHKMSRHFISRTSNHWSSSAMRPLVF